MDRVIGILGKKLLLGPLSPLDEDLRRGAVAFVPYRGGDDKLDGRRADFVMVGGFCKMVGEFKASFCFDERVVVADIKAQLFIEELFSKVV